MFLEFANFMNENNIDHIKVVLPQANGQVVRVNRTLAAWSKYLCDVEYSE